MSKFIRKISYSCFTIFLAVTSLFFVIRLSPGDPVEKILGPEASYEEIVILKSQLGLDKSVSKQYISFLKNLSSGNMGRSLFKKEEVIVLLKKHMPPTILLAIISIMFSAIIGTALGIWAGYKKKKLFDNVGRIISLLALSFPIFSQIRYCCLFIKSSSNKFSHDVFILLLIIEFDIYNYVLNKF